MPTITQMAPQKKGKERLNVYVDEEYFCAVSLDTAVKMGIVVGKNMDDHELSLLLSESGENDLYIKALHYIVKSPRTEREIRNYLHRKQASPATSARIIEKLKTANFINDEAYTRMFVEQAKDTRGTGAIRNKLFQRGIDRTLIDQSLELVNEESQEDLAKRITDKFLRRTNSRDYKTMQKLMRHLVSKGFDYELSNQIVEARKNDGALDPEAVQEYRDKWDEYRRIKEDEKRRKAELRTMRKKIMNGEDI